ncbi:glycosyltransferase [Actinokineospora sp. G85]|uniref:glycosyltransferase n=1 Tax=Actinokineospora sp. G85 TaxID=3406626 RepID=UPI003C74C7F7
MARIAVFPLEAEGHATPMRAVVAALAPHADVRVYGPASRRALFAGTGAAYEPVDPPDVPTPDGLPVLSARTYLRPLGTITDLVESTARFAPQVVLHDVFGAEGAAVAGCLDVPAAALVALPGYGALTDDFVRRHHAPHPALAEGSARWLAEVGFDPMALAGLPTLFPSPVLSLVTTTEELSCPVDPRSMPLLARSLAPHLAGVRTIGPCLGPAASGDFPFADLAEARARGRQVILFSLGTVLTDFRYESPVGGAPTGRDYLTTLVDRLITAFGDRPDTVVVAAVGPRLPDRAWPANFLVRRHVPQVALLAEHVDVFITHNGMGSTTESLVAGVPMVSVPGAGDQLATAALVRGHGAAVAPWDLLDPYRTCTADLLRAAVAAARQDRVRAACARLGAGIRAAGGPRRARELLVDLVK